jgi:hypothetical protein
LRNRQEREDLDRVEAFRKVAQYNPGAARAVVDRLERDDDPTAETFAEILKAADEAREVDVERHLDRVEQRTPPEAA